MKGSIKEYDDVHIAPRVVRNPASSISLQWTQRANPSLDTVAPREKLFSARII